MDSESRSESALNSPTEPDISMAASLTDQPPEAQTLEEARKIIRDLRMRYRAQAHQLLIWRRAHKIQEDISSRVQREKAEQLKSLSSQLLLFESRLIRKQKEITALLAQRETIIMRQQRIIESLTNKLLDNGLEPAHPIVDYRDLINETNLVADFDSLNDSDSAVIMEDLDSDYNTLSHMLPRFRSASTDSVTIVRSISDAIDPNLKYTSVRRSNGFLRRPEILETVYSVEEEPDGDGPNKLSAQNSTEKDIFKDGNADKEDANALMTQAQNRRDIFKMRSEKVSGEAGKITTEVAKLDTKNLDANGLTDAMCQQIAWAYSYVPKRQISNLAYSDDNLSDSHILDGSLLLGECPLEKSKGNQVTTYNRVMSNHRSVTKPKDVKYKRINKAKSKSLEELRGRLRNWVEKGNKLTGISLDQAQSYA